MPQNTQITLKESEIVHVDGNCFEAGHRTNKRPGIGCAVKSVGTA